MGMKNESQSDPKESKILIMFDYNYINYLKKKIIRNLIPDQDLVLDLIRIQIQDLQNLLIRTKKNILLDQKLQNNQKMIRIKIKNNNQKKKKKCFPIFLGST